VLLHTRRDDGREHHHEGRRVRFVRRVRRLPRAVHFVRAPRAAQDVRKTSARRAQDLKAQKDVNEKRTTELETCRSDLKAQKDENERRTTEFKTCRSDLKAQKDENERRTAEFKTTESACTKSEAQVKELWHMVDGFLLWRASAVCKYISRERQLHDKYMERVKEQGEELTRSGAYTSGKLALMRQIQSFPDVSGLCSEIAKIDEMYDYNLTHIRSLYEYHPDGDLWTFERKN